MMCNNQSKSGFTLIEFLVVISVLAILAALLFPVFSAVRHKARMATCSSNLHQVGLAIQLYAADADEHYPPNDNHVFTLLEAQQNKTQLVWSLLMPYTHDQTIFHCPEEGSIIDKARGYDYRTALIGSPLDPFGKRPRPGSGLVVASCSQHTERSQDDAWSLDAEGNVIGSMPVVREDGSVSQIQGEQMSFWEYQNGQWIIRHNHFCPPAATLCTVRFPGETWPPEFEP